MTNCCSCGHRSTRDWLCSHGLYKVGQTNHQHICGACRTRPPCCDPGCGCTNDTIVCGKARRVSHRHRRTPLPDPACPTPRQIPVYSLSYSALKTKRTTTSAMPLYTPYRSRSRLLRRCRSSHHHLTPASNPSYVRSANQPRSRFPRASEREQCLDSAQSKLLPYKGRE